MAKSDGGDLIAEKRQRLLDFQSDLRTAYAHVLPKGTLLFRCEQCTTIYPLNHFARKDDRYYGIRPVCTRCYNAARRNQRYEPDLSLHEKYCHGCDVVHPISEFTVNRARPSGYDSNCRQHNRERRLGLHQQRPFREITQCRHEQTIRLCGELDMDHPGYNIKRCGHCGCIKHIDEFGSDWHNRDRKSSRCLRCRRRIAASQP